MDPITATLIAAIAAGATQVGQSAVVDTYNGLKALIQRKYGKTPLPKAVESLELKPQSENYQGMVKEEVEDTQADKDPDILQAVKELAAALEKTPEGQKALGKFNIQASNIQGVVQAERIDNLTQNFGKN